MVQAVSCLAGRLYKRAEQKDLPVARDVSRIGKGMESSE